MRHYAVPLMVTLCLGGALFSAHTYADTPDTDDLPMIQNGFYLTVGYSEATKDTFMRDTFFLERNGDNILMRPLNERKINKPLKGLIDDDLMTIHSQSEDYYGGGAFFFHCKIDKGNITGSGAMPKKKEQVFSVKLTRIAVPIIDERDGQRYNTICIGTQYWMAENVRYYDTLGGIYRNPDNPDKIYGCLYSWEAVQRACPRGWHVPTREDWNTLVKFLGYKIAGTKLKSATGWGGNATGGRDMIGFSAYPAGHYDPETQTFGDIGLHTFFWAIDQQNSKSSWYRNIYNEYPGMYEFNDRKEFGLSCRCIQD